MENNNIELEKYDVLSFYCDWLEDYIVSTTNISDGRELYMMFLIDILKDDLLF